MINFKNIKLLQGFLVISIALVLLIFIFDVKLKVFVTYWIFFTAYLISIYPLYVLGFYLYQYKELRGDPMVILFFVLLQMFGLSFIVISFDPSLISPANLGFGSSVFYGSSSIDDILLILSKSQLLLGIFTWILISTNANISIIKSQKTDRNYTPIDKYLSYILLIILIGIVPFVLAGFGEKTLLIGAEVDDLESLGGVYSILFRSSLFFAPFILIGIGVRNISVFLFLLITISLLDIINVSRSGVMYSILFGIVYSYSVGFKYKKKHLIFVFSTIAIILLIMTTIRFYNMLYNRVGYSTDINDLMKYGFSIENNPMMGSDRIKPLALAIKNVDDKADYLFGQTLIARPIKVFNIMLRKFNLPEIKGFKTADEVSHSWRFGENSRIYKNWAVPVTIPGEFYIQFGWISFLFFSYIFAKIIYFLRMKLYSVKTSFQHMLYFFIIMALLKSISSELMFYSNIFIFTLPIIITLHYLLKKLTY